MLNGKCLQCERIQIMNNQFVFCFSRHIVDKLIQYCEKLSDAAVCSQRKTLDNVLFVTPFEKDGNLFLFEKTAETLVLSKKPLSTIDISADKLESDTLPDMYPLTSNSSMETDFIYEKRNIYRKFNKLQCHCNGSIFNEQFVVFFSLCI